MQTGRQRVQSTLRARGVRLPESARIDAYLNALDDARHADLLEVLRRIQKGVEHPNEIQRLLTAIGEAAEPSTPEASGWAPPASRPSAGTAPDNGSGHAGDRREAVAEKSNATASSSLALLRSHGVSVWSTSAALKLELARLGPVGEPDLDQPRYTVQVDGARRSGSRVDWTRKTIFQLTQRELPLLASFLLGFAGKRLEFTNHGPSNDKALRIEEQGSKFFWRLSGGGSPMVALPIDYLDAYACAEIVLTALTLNRPHCPATMQIAMLRRLGAMHTLPPECKREG